MVFKYMPYPIVGFVCHTLIRNNRRRHLSSVRKLVYKHANTCFVTLYMMMPFLSDKLHVLQKHNFNIETIKSDLKIEFIKSDNANKKVPYYMKFSRHFNFVREFRDFF